MSNNDYSFRPWHLSEATHVTNWATDQMCTMIRRRDPTRPGLWFLSYCHPHPPLVPLEWYYNLYRDIEIPLPYRAAWSQNFDELPYPLQVIQTRYGGAISDEEIQGIHRAFYALCTHIDHQLRRVIGTLREEMLLDNTSSASPATTAICRATTACGPSASTMSSPPTSRCCCSARPATNARPPAARMTASSAGRTSCPPCSTWPVFQFLKRRGDVDGRPGPAALSLRRSGRRADGHPHDPAGSVQTDLLRHWQPFSAFRSGCRSPRRCTT